MKTAEKIRFLRTMRGYSQDNMADMIGMSRQAYGEIERGHTEPSKDRLEKIVAKLGMSVKDLETFDNTISNFFDQCNGPNVNAGVNHNPQQTNNYDARELKHENEKLLLENKLLQSEKEKAEIEAKYWREKNQK